MARLKPKTKTPPERAKFLKPPGLPEPRWCIDFAYLRDGNLFIIGWLLEGVRSITAMAAELGATRYDLTHYFCRLPRPDVALVLGPEAACGPEQCGLLALARVDARRVDGKILVLHIALSDGTMLRLEAPLSDDSEVFASFTHQYRNELRQMLARLAPAVSAPLSAAAFAGEGGKLLVRFPHDIERHVQLSLDAAALPVPGRLLLLGRIADPAGAITALSVSDPTGELFLPQWTSLGRLPNPKPWEEGLERFVLLARVPTHETGNGCIFSAASEARIWQHPLQDAFAAKPGLDALAEIFSALDAPTRLMVLELLAQSDVEEALTGEESAALHRLWYAAIEDLPERLFSPKRGLLISPDPALAIPGLGVLVRGWASLDPALSLSLTFCTPGGIPVELTGAWHRHPRLDARAELMKAGAVQLDDEVGFTALVRVPPAAQAACGYLLLRQGTKREAYLRVPMVPLPAEPRLAAQALFDAFPFSLREIRTALADHLAPALATFWPPKAATPVAPMVFSPSRTQAEITVSFIIRVAEEPERIARQLAAFADDADLVRAEMLYVIDNPALYEAALLLCQDLPLFEELSSRLIYGKRVLGQAGAYNLGANFARGQYLVLLASDVLPTKPGWLAEMLAAHAALPKAGALSPRLIMDGANKTEYPAAFRFRRLLAYEGLWLAERVVPPSVGDGRTPKPLAVPALSAAALLVERARFEEAGGFTDLYFEDDFTEADFCLKLAQRGLRHFVLPELVMQKSLPFATPLLSTARLVNMWHFTKNWDAKLASLHERDSPKPQGARLLA